jgi:hypothetical protein
MIHETVSAAGDVIAADIFTTGSTLASKATQTFLAAAAAAIAWGLLKGVFRSPTVVGALVAILVGAGLFWLLTNVRNPSLQKPVTDTVNELGAPARPASEVVVAGSVVRIVLEPTGEGA